MTSTLTKLKCPNCGWAGIEAMIRHDTVSYSEHLVRGVLDGKLVLVKRPIHKWEDDVSEAALDEDLQCRACKRAFRIEDVGIEDQREGFVFEAAADIDRVS